MLFNKILCGVTAALLFFNVSLITARASIAEVPPLKLLTVNVDDICGEASLDSIGGNCYIDCNNNIYMLDDRALSEWRRTGKANFSKLSCDMDLKDMYYNRIHVDVSDGYIQFFKRRPDTSDHDCFVFRLDEDAKKLSLAYSCPRSRLNLNLDGYSYSYDLNGDGKFIVTDPSGNITETPFPRNDGSHINFYEAHGEYIAYCVWESYVHMKDGRMTHEYAVYAFKRDGGCEKIYGEDGVNNFNVESSGFNCIMWRYNEPSWPLYIYKILSEEDNMVYWLGETLTYQHMGEPDYFMTEPGLIGSEIKDQRVVLYNRISYFGNEKEDETLYYLVKLNENAPAQIISKRYRHLEEAGGGFYLAETYEGKTGFIDKDGNELAMFDNAGEFRGEYAPVVKDGKVYLIDRNMKIVSEGISADIQGSHNFGKDLFFLHDGDKELIATYADNLADAEGNGDNPVVGAADVLIPTAFAGGTAAAVSFKRHKKKK